MRGGGGGEGGEAGGAHSFIDDSSTSKTEKDAFFTPFGAKNDLAAGFMHGEGRRASRILPSLKIERPQARQTCFKY